MIIETAIQARILNNVNVLPGGCWEWSLGVSKVGYGKIKVCGRTVGAHRVSYEAFKCEIPDGLEIDHLCRNRKCVNPAHLEAVTREENNRRYNEHYWAINDPVTHCVHGHEYRAENIYDSTGKRVCRTCTKQNAKAYYSRNRAVVRAKQQAKRQAARDAV